MSHEGTARIDTNENREAVAEFLTGFERTICKEAISLTPALSRWERGNSIQSLLQSMPLFVCIDIRGFCGIENSNRGDAGRDKLSSLRDLFFGVADMQAMLRQFDFQFPQQLALIFLQRVQGKVRLQI
ncbi:MAG: hypothetical protein JWM68_2028 [Verrucomicrobiales bacterium]|nr:hypothetical protein [Verrucomicrobiales bacterium]